MLKTITTWKKMTLIVSQAMLLGIGGGCLPNNTFAETAGDIVSALITVGANIVLAGSNIQV